MPLILIELVAFILSELTRTSKTEDSYLKKAEGILNRTAIFYGVAIKDVSANMLVQYVIDNRVSYSRATFRQYKAALIFFLNTYRHIYSDAPQAIEYLLGVDQSECQKKTNQTSQLRRKNFTIDQFNQLLFAISLTESDFSRATALWLQCGVLTGLRPHEWQNTSLEETSSGKRYLVVKNAKHTNGRGHGEYRHIEITDFSPKEMKILTDFREIVQLYQDNEPLGFDRLQRACIDFLKYLNRKLLKGDFNKEYFQSKKGSGVYKYRYDGLAEKRITLYSARHFFSSQAKKSMLSLEEIAALMGHKTNRTATEHYGKAQYAQGGLKVKPVTEEVAKIEQKHQNNFTQVKQAPTVQPTPAYTPKMR